MEKYQLLMDHDAFMRRIHRQNKDRHWESDIRNYTFWKEHLNKYPQSESAMERVKYYEEKYPQLNEIGE